MWRGLGRPARQRGGSVPVGEIRIAALRPEILIRPKLGPGLNVENFKRMDEAVEAGYQEAMSVLNSHPLLKS